MRTLLATATAAGAALLVLTAGGCASTVAGSGAPDLALAPTTAPTTAPTGGPTTGPTTGPTDDPTDPTGTPTGNGDPGDQQAVADVTERWYHGIAAGAGEAVCALMTPRARASVAKDGASCPTAVRRTDLTSAQRDAMSKVEVEPDGVTVSGDSARVPAAAVTVNGRSSTATGAIQVARVGGAWYVDNIG